MLTKTLQQTTFLQAPVIDKLCKVFFLFLGVVFNVEGLMPWLTAGIPSTFLNVFGSKTANPWLTTTVLLHTTMSMSHSD